MQIPDQLRPRLVLVRRVLMWTGMALLLFAGLFTNPFGSTGKQAWAAVTACPGQLSIPMAPIVLNLTYGVSATYEASLCQEPTAPVTVTNNVDTSDPITVSPPSLTFATAQTQTVAVSVAAGHPADQPFTFVITHTAASADPEFNDGALNVPTVTVYYSPPVAVDDYAAAPHGQSISITVLANDIDRVDQGLVLPPGAIVTNPANGSASVNPNQTLQYTPTAGFVGIDTFTYQVEDGNGNTDIGTVTVGVAPTGTIDPQIAPVDPDQENDVEFDATFGAVQVTIPPLTGVPDGAEVVFIFSEVVTPTGDVDEPPVPDASFTGITFRFDGFVDGVPIDPDQLSGPITVTVLLPDEVAEALDIDRLIVAVWDGTKWTTEGISMGENTSPTSGDTVPLTFTTTVFGEFAIFELEEEGSVIFIPYIEAN